MTTVETVTDHTLTSIVDNETITSVSSCEIVLLLTGRPQKHILKFIQSQNATNSENQYKQNEK